MANDFADVDVSLYSLPLSGVALTSAILPLFTLGRSLSKQRRRRAGLCPACGYDLRAPHRCPECEPSHAHAMTVRPPPHDLPLPRPSAAVYAPRGRASWRTHAPAAAQPPPDMRRTLRSRRKSPASSP